MASGDGRTSEFCGLSFTEHADDFVSIGCEKLMASMDLLLATFGPAPQSYDTPMESDALQRIRGPESDSNPLVDHVPAAQAILGLGLYITRSVRTDCLFPALALS